MDATVEHIKSAKIGPAKKKRKKESRTELDNKTCPNREGGKDLQQEKKGKQQSEILRRIEENDPGVVYTGTVQDVQDVWVDLSIPLEYRTKKPFWNLYTEGCCDKIFLATREMIKITPSDWLYGTLTKYAV